MSPPQYHCSAVAAVAQPVAATHSQVPFILHFLRDSRHSVLFGTVTSRRGSHTKRDSLLVVAAQHHPAVNHSFCSLPPLLHSCLPGFWSSAPALVWESKVRTTSKSKRLSLPATKSLASVSPFALSVCAFASSTKEACLVASCMDIASHLRSYSWYPTRECSELQCLAGRRRLPLVRQALCGSHTH